MLDQVHVHVYMYVCMYTRMCRNWVKNQYVYLEGIVYTVGTCTVYVYVKIFERLRLDMLPVHV